MKIFYLTTVLIIGLCTISSGQTYNTSYGESTGTTGGANSFFGHSAGMENISGYRNSYFGASSGYHLSTGKDNSFFGTFSGKQNTIGNNNTFIGHHSGTLSTSGSGNTFLGGNSGRSNKSGQNNVYLGSYAGYSNQSGIRNVFIGLGAGYSETGSNKLHINNQATGNSLISGDFLTDKVGINAATLVETLTVNGAIHIGNTNGQNDGSIRYTGVDFEGRLNGNWESLTAVSAAFQEWKDTEWTVKEKALQDKYNTLKEEIDNLKELVSALSSSSDEPNPRNNGNNGNPNNNGNNESGIKLDQNVPNPGIGDVSISYNLPGKRKGKIVVYTLDGEVVLTSPLDTGEGVLVIQAGKIPNGTYAYSLVVGDKLKRSRRMIIDN